MSVFLKTPDKTGTGSEQCLRSREKMKDCEVPVPVLSGSLILVAPTESIRHGFVAFFQHQPLKHRIPNFLQFRFSVPKRFYAFSEQESL